jgi:hypothetical protein
MAMDQRSKRRLFFFVYETMQQLLVRPWAGVSPLSEPPNMLEDGVNLPVGHMAQVLSKQALGVLSTMIEPAGGK